jgi:hypothetical protein
MVAGSAGVLILAGLVIAVFLATNRGESKSTATVQPPPPQYSVLSRPQTAEEAALELPRFLADADEVDRSSLRLASDQHGVRHVLFRNRNGDVCMYVLGPSGGGGGGCGVAATRPLISAVGGEVVGNRYVISALVPDAITAAVVNGQDATIDENVVHISLPGSTTRVSVDYFTDEGVVSAWHQSQVIDPGPVRPGPTPAFGQQARLLQPRPPYVGVACPRANDFRCDRVGITVWLRRPALRVEAKVWGRRVVLNDAAWSGPVRNGRRTKFAGFLQPAGLLSGPHRLPRKNGATRWIGDPPMTVPVIINVFTAPNAAASASMRVRLSPGWG